jgi:hypothetical protein
MNSSEAFVSGRSAAQARRLLDAAKDLDLDPRLVRTTDGGYIVPSEIVDHLEGPSEPVLEEPDLEGTEQVPAEPDAESDAETPAEEVEADDAETPEDEETKPAPRRRRSTKSKTDDDEGEN